MPRSKKKAAQVPAAPAGTPVITLEVALASNGVCARDGEPGVTCYQQASALSSRGYCYAHDRDADLSPPGKAGQWIGSGRGSGQKGRPPATEARRGAPARTSDQYRTA